MNQGPQLRAATKFQQQKSMELTRSSETNKSLNNLSIPSVWPYAQNTYSYFSFPCYLYKMCVSSRPICNTNKLINLGKKSKPSNPLLEDRTKIICSTKSEYLCSIIRFHLNQKASSHHRVRHCGMQSQNGKLQESRECQFCSSQNYLLQAKDLPILCIQSILSLPFLLAVRASLLTWEGMFSPQTLAHPSSLKTQWK